MVNWFFRGWNWCRRFRHRCGYGVHSPSDFFLITFVVYERMAFYAYRTLHDKRKAVLSLPHYREKVDKFLFRFTNYWQPSSILEIGTGSGLSTVYMAEAKQVPVHTYDCCLHQDVKNLLASYPQIVYHTEDAWQKTIDFSADLVHIAHTPYYKEVFEVLCSKAGSRTCFVIASPYATKEKKEWWNSVIADLRTGVTFDLYDVGIVFFDKQRIKEHRIVNFL